VDALHPHLLKLDAVHPVQWFILPHIRKTGASDAKTYSVLTSEIGRIDTVSMSEVVKYDGSAYGPPMSKQMVPHMVEYGYHMRHHIADVETDVETFFWKMVQPYAAPYARCCVRH
jgi:hypothetical protein